jgi:hypothetical protein
MLKKTLLEEVVSIIVVWKLDGPLDDGTAKQRGDSATCIGIETEVLQCCLVFLAKTKCI